MTMKKTLLRLNPFCEFEERFQNSNPHIEKKRSKEQQREIDIHGRNPMVEDPWPKPTLTEI